MATLRTMQSPDALVMPVVAALALVLAVWKTLWPRVGLA
jgi:hypothetical protein